MLMVNALAGCLSADTVININRGGKGMKIDIETLVKQFLGEPVYYVRNGRYRQSPGWDKKIPTRVACNVDGVVVSKLLKDAWYSGEKQTYQLTTITGRNIRATYIHPFLTADGTYIKLGNLRVGSLVAVNIGKSSGGLKVKKNYASTLTRYHPNQVNNGNGYKVPNHRLIIEAKMNDISLRDFISILRYDEERSKSLSYLPRELLVRHKDGDEKNNTLDNLEIVTHKEHSDKHDWGRNVLDQIGYESIVSIEKYKVERTFDLEMDSDPHNFMANGFVVHNTGKTSTGIWGLGARVPSNVKVSDEQKAIIKLMRTYTGSQAAMAFNRSIADKLKEEAPKSCVCNTSNGFGHQAWARHLDMKLGQPDNLKNRKICRELIGKSMEWKERLRVEAAVDGIVGLCKSYLFDPCTSERKNWISGDTWVDGLGAMMWLCDRFDIDNDPCVLDYAVRTFTKGVEPNAFIDWDDQIFLPLYHGISLPVYDHVMVDEAQDLNRAKQELAFRMAKNITAVGDRNQAIYGFSGADSEAMENMWKRMQEADSEAQMLPLTITRRNPRKVVELANQLVPELKARPDAPEGIVENMPMDKFHKEVGNVPSMVICRINAPLSSLAFKLLAQGKRCYIQGRDIGAGLKSEIKRTGESELSTALSVVHDRIERRKMEILQRDFPDENQIEALNDKLSCIDILAGDADTVEEFNGIVDRLFKDSGDKKDTRLSSIHKAKGLEHPIVHVYMSNKLMQNFTRKGRKEQVYQREQEKNLAYVGYTRSMNELYQIPEEKVVRNYE